MTDEIKLKNDLLSYQIEAVEKLYKIKVGALFMEQGTGKSITALELCRRRLIDGKITYFIWLCPCSAKQNIKDELLKQCPNEMLSCVTICGIESLSSSIRVNSYLLSLATKERCCLLVDESLLAKNPNAYRTKNIIRLAELCSYRIILNGTPVSRNEADLFSQFYILDWRILGYKSYWSFSANHLEYDEINPKRVVNCLNTDYLARKIAPYTFQIQKKDCLVLPDKKYRTIYFNMEKEQKTHYCEIADQLLFEIDELKPETIYRLFTALQGIACSRRILFRKGKNGYLHLYTIPFFVNSEDNPRMKELLNIVDGETKTIIFCNFKDEITEVCNAIDKRFGKGAAVRFDGDISIKKRTANLMLFKKDTVYLVANRNCAGYSLNLQFCHRIIYFSNDWNLATRMQSEDRVHRIGQTLDIDIIDLCAEQTIDEGIQRCLERKENLLESFKNEIKLSTDTKGLISWLNAKRTIKESHIFDCSDLQDIKRGEGDKNA